MDKLIIEAGKTERQYWRDLLRYRELFYFLAWRDILVRYKQTVVGVAWAVLRPLLTMIILTVVFGKLAKMPSGDVPYAILVFSGMLPWQFFATALSESGNSLVSNAGMISKIYFPRLVLPASSVIISLADFLVSAVIMAALMAWYGYLPSANIVCLPLFIGMAFAIAFGAGLWIAALMVKYRDFRFIVPIHRPVRSVHFSGRLLQQCRAWPMAPPLFAKPYGRCYRRLPLGNSRRRTRRSTYRDLCFRSECCLHWSARACGISGRPKRRLRISSERVRGALGSRVRRLRRVETSIRIWRSGNTAGALFAILRQFPARRDRC